MVPKEGDFVRITCKDETVEGVLLPSKEDFVTIKLSSGYNLGMDRSRIVKMELLSPRVPKPVAKRELKKHSNLPVISVLQAGGTIASKVDYETGAAIARFSAEDLFELYPELVDIATIRSRLCGVNTTWSQDMRFSHYNLFAAEIKKEIEEGADGIIFTMGTDFIHYTAAAFSFMFESLPVPILIVGAQRSSDRGSSDAAINLLNAVYFMTHSDFAEVGVCMHADMSDDKCWILPGTKCRKLHTSRRDAFRPVNADPWAFVDYVEKKINFVGRDYRKREKRPIVFKPFKESIKVGLIKTHINMFAEEFSFYKDYDGLVIEASGMGCLPITERDELTKESGKIAKAISELIKKGVVVAEAPQTIFGRINMNVYDDQRAARQMGVLGHLCDMTPETAFIKLAWLLSNYSKKEAQKLFEQNLRGEISDRTNEVFLV